MMNPIWKVLEEAVPLPLPSLKEKKDIDAYNKWADAVKKKNLYYEVYWFPFSDKAWINAFNVTEDMTGVVDYPSPFNVGLENFEGFMSTISNSTMVPLLPALMQCKISSTLSEKFMDNIPVKTYFIDALHAHRGVQQTRVFNFEYTLAVPCIPNTNEPDLSIGQRVWWDTIHLTQAKAHKDPNDCPLRLVLQMKFVANSNVLMAVSHNCQWGICVIEVVTPILTPKDQWKRYKQELSDLWCSYPGIRVRPHWAKEWQDVTIDGKPMEDHMKKVYADELPVFHKLQKQIAKHGGYSVSQMQMFATPSLKKIFYDHK